MRACEIFISDLLVASEFGGVPDGPVIERIFQRVAGRGGDLVVRHVAEFHIVTKPCVPICLRSGHHRFESSVSVNVQAFGDSVGQHRHSVVAAHAPVLVGAMAPDRQEVKHILVVVSQHRLHHVPVALRFEQRQERMLGAVGVPK